jgi:hypothetical protein
MLKAIVRTTEKLRWEAWLSSQYQVMDAMRPIIHLWINLPENSPLMEAVESGLQLLGGASANIAKMRRLSMWCTKLRFRCLHALWSTCFLFKGNVLPFRKKFLEAMGKKVKRENTLAKIGHTNGSYNRYWSTGINRWGKSIVFCSGDHGHSSSAK